MDVIDGLRLTTSFDLREQIETYVEARTSHVDILGPPNDVSIAVLSIRAAALEESERWVAAKPGREQIRDAARRLCAQKLRYADPDEVTMGVADQGPMLGAKKTVAFALPIRPQWMMFIEEACAALNIDAA